MSRYLIIADDITGSNDTGVQLKRRGIETVVTLDAEVVNQQQASCVLDTESRPLEADAAFNKVYDAVRKIDMSGFSHIVKKVDSTLRGAIAHEIAAIDKCYNPELIVFMPALPDLGRTTLNGVHMLHGKPITQTELAQDPRTPVRQDDLRKLLESVYTEPVTHVGVHDVESGNICLNGGRVFTFDAVTNAHMRAVVAAAVATGKKVLWVGAAAIVDSIMETEVPVYPAVALVASLSETTRDQVCYAQERGVEVVVIPAEHFLYLLENNGHHSEALMQDSIENAVCAIGKGRDVIVVSAATFNRAEFEKILIAGEATGMPRNDVSLMVLKYMGLIMAGIMRQAKISGVFLTGGDTAMSLLSEIGALGMRIISEVLIGIPLMRLVGGKYHNTKVITKAGAFGQSDALFFCMRKLRETD